MPARLLESQYIEFAFLFNSRINSDQFFEMIAYDLNLPCQRTSKTEVLFALNQLLVEQAQEGRTVVLLVDEAHNLEWEVLEEIRLLGNLENRNGKLLQIVLSGQPELDRKLDAPNLRQLKQRIVLRCNLAAVHATRRGGVYGIASGKGGHARADRIFRRIDGRDSRSRARHPAPHQRPLRQPALTAFALERKVCTVDMLDEVCRDMRLEWPAAAGCAPEFRKKPLLSASGPPTRSSARGNLRRD